MRNNYRPGRRADALLTLATLTILTILAAGSVVSGCRARPGAAGGGASLSRRDGRDGQAQQYILRRRAAARNSRPTHTSH